ncbi:MAG TPA: hypothetical protein VGH34_21045 [Vicinamibacterales bacterium]|jgi:hypothetical protein
MFGELTVKQISVGMPSDAVGDEPSPRRRRFVGWRRGATYLVAMLLSLYVAATIVRIYARRYDTFLIDYVRQSVAGTPALTASPTHIFFLFVDHFEPDWDLPRTVEWATRYRALAARHRDSSGRPPQHTWFYPGEQIEPAILTILQSLTRDGFGEVELHYHHEGDTAQTLTIGLRAAIAEFQTFGFLKTRSGQTAFAFIHGNESLDNADGEYCGVNTELRVLHDLGCFADFTFPSLYHRSQPSTVNTVYAARDDDRPKSYNTPYPLSDLRDGAADLAIFQGPVILAPTWNPRRLFIDVDDGNIHAGMPTDARRVKRWVNARIHVPERPDWLFVKVFAHSVSTADDEQEMFGGHFEQALTELEQHYDDGRKYVLHYVTAREAYNLAMAAANGATDAPAAHLDGEIPPYVAGVRPLP